MNKRGFTLVETIIGVAIIGVVMATLTTAIVNNSKRSSASGRITQGSQVLNYFVRRIAGGSTVVLPKPGKSLTWDYGTLSSAFSDLSSEPGAAKPKLYKVTVNSLGEIGFIDSVISEYSVVVCVKVSDDESCITAETLGPKFVPGDVTPTLPGIN